MASLLHSLKEIVSFIGVIFLLLIFLIILFTLGYSITYVYPYHAHPLFAIPFYLAIPFPVMVFSLKGLGAYAWYLLIATAVMASSVYITYRGIFPYFSEFFRRPFSYKHNPFQDIMELFSISMFFTLIVYYISVLMGIKPSTIGVEKYPVWFQMLQLLHASVYEELIIRVLFLGVPLFLTYRFTGTKLPPTKLLGGGYKIGRWETVYLLISSVIFGFAHMSSWGFWKVIPAFVAGLALGYLYLKYGIFASITLHFINDFISIPMTLVPELTLPMSIITIYFLVAGAAFLVSYSIRIYHHFVPPKKKMQEKMRLPPPPPPPWGAREKGSLSAPGPWIELRCPHCGGDVFQYVDKDKLRCLNCGAIIDVSAYRGQSAQSEIEEHHP